MGLRAQAALDVQAILEDTTEFGQTVTLTNPSEQSADLTGYTNDVGVSLDPSTGAAVSARRMSVALPIKALSDAGLGLPIAVSDPDAKPWRVTFEDLAGNSQTFKVTETQPDRTLGIVVCLLEVYRS
jgi:hypothetical protein